MKRLSPLSTFLVVAGLVMVSFMFLAKGDGHACKWQQCPYKGITADLAHRSVSAYVGEVGTDAYCLDMLHLQYPNEDYEQLETRLFNNK